MNYSKSVFVWPCDFNVECYAEMIDLRAWCGLFSIKMVNFAECRGWRRKLLIS